VALEAVALLHRAGVPKELLHCLPMAGRAFGEAAMRQATLAGVVFTGSTATAQWINRALAARHGAILPLIAETGGQNAMIVDSSALPEQVVIDAAYSAFNSAGQRCSALRVLCVQEDIAPKVQRLLAGHMNELVVGDPRTCNDVARHRRDSARHARGHTHGRCEAAHGCR
jgi:RHH-type proline utilization regulon transcriptional repressor/proline dehydrogenase/delta 1-pyrroline-5-carboxylate dehydrogenase